MAIQFVLGYQFHRALQKVCEFLRQRQTLREQVVTSRKVHQEIHVAVDPLLAPRDGAEHSEAPCAVLLPQARNGFSFAMYLIQKHIGAFAT
jgi:hypothetical protein